jgi:riboflavin kinase
LSDEAIDALVSGLETGVYYGWTQIGQVSTEVYPMVMSLGWNPYFHNEKRSAVSSIIKHDLYIYIIYYSPFINV